MKFIEKSKDASTLLGEHSQFFLSELEILNYDDKKPSKEKKDRFDSLLRRYFNGDLGQLDQTVYVHSQDLLKATVRFNLSKIQVNHFNKAYIKIESLTSYPLSLRNLKFKFNMDSIDFERKEEIHLSQENPIEIEQELFISFDDFAEYIIL